MVVFKKVTLVEPMADKAGREGGGKRPEVKHADR